MRKFRKFPHPTHLYKVYFKGGSIPTIPPPPPPSSPVKETSKEVQQAAADEKRKQAMKRGRQSTILNGNKGLGDSAANVKKKTLLGG